MARVLVAERDEGIQEALCLLFEFGGYDVTGVSSLAEALTRIDNETFQLIVTSSFADSGLAAAGKLQALQQRAQPTPVGVITGWSLAPETAEQAGFAFVIAKPFEIDQVLAQVATALSTQLSPAQERQAQVVRRYFAALTTRDWDALIDLCTETVVYVLPVDALPFSGTITGKAAFRAYTEDTFSHFPQARFEDVEVYAAPSGLASRYRGTWVSPSGDALTLAGAVHFQFAEDDRISQIGVNLNGERLDALFSREPPSPAPPLEQIEP